MQGNEYDFGSMFSKQDEECLRHRQLGVITLNCKGCRKGIIWVCVIAFDLDRHTLLVKGVCLSCMRYLDFVEFKISDVYTKALTIEEGDMVALDGDSKPASPVN